MGIETQAPYKGFSDTIPKMLGEADESESLDFYLAFAGVCEATVITVMFGCSRMVIV